MRRLRVARNKPQLVQATEPDVPQLLAAHYLREALHRTYLFHQGLKAEHDRFRASHPPSSNSPLMLLKQDGSDVSTQSLNLA